MVSNGRCFELGKLKPAFSKGGVETFNFQPEVWKLGLNAVKVSSPCLRLVF